MISFRLPDWCISDGQVGGVEVILDSLPNRGALDRGRIDFIVIFDQENYSVEKKIE